METIARELEKIINEHGAEYLRREPYEVYCKLLTAGLSVAHASLVLITLLSGSSTKALKLDVEKLSRDIEKECHLQKNIAYELASMYNLLFSKKNIANWKMKMDYGFQDFCGKSWKFKWSGSGTWNSGNVHIDCWCDITAEIEVLDKDVARREVSGMLKENPFTPTEKIYDFFFEQISDALDEDLENYITCEDYYPPVMEDYYENGEYALNERCGKLGLKVTFFGCDGSMSDFEPNHRR